MLPQEASLKQNTLQEGKVADDERKEISSQVSPNEAHSEQDASGQEITRQQGTVAGDELLSSQETVISSSTGRSPNKAHSVQDASGQEVTRQQGTVAGDKLLSSLETVISSSTGKYRKHEFKEISSNILNLMHKASEEKQSIRLLHVIECNDLNIVKVLPLILQCTISFGVGHTEAIEMLEKVQHLSKKWIINQTEEVSTKLPKDFSSHKIPFAIEATVHPNVSARDLALFSHETKEEALPYAWFFLCHSIQNGFKEIQRKVMSFEEVSGIAIKSHISMDELPKILSYLHKIGLLLYYESILPNVVFEDASLIIKILSSAIDSELFSGYDSIIHISSFSQVNDAYIDHLFTFKDAIKLLENMSIIFPIGDTQTFSMPTLLKKVFDEKSIIRRGHVSPLIVQYPRAPGVFEYLVCYLVSEQNENLWPWKIQIDKRFPTCLYKNCAELVLPGYDCIITLLESSDSIRVYVEFVYRQPPFAKIRDSIIAGLKRATSSYHYPDVSIKLGFNCTCGSVDFEHTAVYHEQNKNLECPYNSNRETFPLSHTQKVWFEEGKVLHACALYILIAVTCIYLSQMVHNGG